MGYKFSEGITQCQNKVLQVQNRMKSLDCVCVCYFLSHAQLFATPWDSSSARFFCPWDSPGKNTRVGSHSFFQGILLTQGSNLGLPHCRQILYYLTSLATIGFYPSTCSVLECSHRDWWNAAGQDDLRYRDELWLSRKAARKSTNKYEWSWIEPVEHEGHLTVDNRE